LSIKPSLTACCASQALAVVSALVDDRHTSRHPLVAAAKTLTAEARGLDARVPAPIATSVLLVSPPRTTVLRI
jgi:hypothetical protein